MEKAQRDQTVAPWLGNRALLATLVWKGIDVAMFVTQRARKFIFLLLLAYAIPVVGQSMGSDVNIRFDRYKTSDLFLLTVNNKNGNDIIVRISNARKEVIFEQSVRFVEKIKKVYNLSTLPKGTYQFSVANNTGSSENVTIETTESFMDHPENGKSILVGFSKITPKKSINLTVQNKTKQSVSIIIQDVQGKMIKQEDLGKEELVKKEVSLDKIPSGKYFIKVGNKDNQFVTLVTI
jgi:Secretion system C-terminal sorting domain